MRSKSALSHLAGNGGEEDSQREYICGSGDGEGAVLARAVHRDQKLRLDQRKLRGEVHVSPHNALSVDERPSVEGGLRLSLRALPCAAEHAAALALSCARRSLLLARCPSARRGRGGEPEVGEHHARRAEDAFRSALALGRSRLVAFVVPAPPLHEHVRRL